MIYNKKYIFGFHPICGPQLLKPLEFLTWGVLKWLLEISWWPGLVGRKTDHVLRGFVRECLTIGFLCAVSHLSWVLGSLSASPRTEIKEMGCLHRISFISFSVWWKGLFTTLFWYGSPFGLASLVTCKAWSLHLYLKKLPVYILLQNSIKHTCSIRAWVPVSFSLSLSLSLSLYFCLIPWSTKAGSVIQGILASFLLSLSHHRLQTSRFWSIKGPQQGLEPSGASPRPPRRAEGLKLDSIDNVQWQAFLCNVFMRVC